MANYNRRTFLQISAAGFLGGAGALAGLGRQQAFAASTSGYKALVCLFLKGGLDTFDTILPYDEPSYSSFATLRSELLGRYVDTYQRSRDALHALTPDNAARFGGRQFGLAPELSSAADLFASGEAAIVGSVGPLLEHTNRAAMEDGRAELPRKLFSHNDQQSTWMALGTEGTRHGWGGGFMDVMQTSGGIARPEFAAITSGSGDVFLAGDRTRQFKAPRDPRGLDARIIGEGWRTSGGHGQDARDRLDAYLLSRAGADNTPFARDVIASQATGLQNLRDYKNAFETRGTLSTVFPDTRIGQQLAAIANSIHIRGTIGNSRQMFYADTGGFDSHSGQAADVPVRQRDVFEAIAAFREAMIETGAWNDVTLFTMSDFGRTLTDNGDGTDHGWGSHHFVFGGSVNGRHIYGDLPELEPNSDRFTKTRARLIPSVSVEQYAGTLGSWFGLDRGEIDRVLPHIGRFDSRDLGFMGAGTA